MITFQDVTYTYPGASQPALRRVNLEIPSGCITLVSGVSGSGKSTLLRCLNGLVPHFTGGVLQGELRVNGLDPVRLSPQAMSRQVGFVFQDPESQFVVDRVEDEIAFGLENAGVPPAEIHIRLQEMLDLLGLSALRRRKLEALSGGERQRVAIAAALALRPRLLVLDEPTSQLDPHSAEEVLQAVRRLNHDLGLEVVLSEHRLERVWGMADFLVHLEADSGRVVSGRPEQAWEQVDLAPPVVRLGKVLGWRPMPLTVEAARQYLQEHPNPDLPQEPGSSPVHAPGTPAVARQGTVPLGSGQPFISARGVAVRYDAFWALRGVDLEVWPGEIVALLGHNGSGKTTLLRALVGLVSLQAGSVSYEGEDTARRDTAEICRRVAYLPQDPGALLFAETVLDELRITLRNHALPMDDQAASDLLQRLGLQAERRSYPRDLSVGQKQRAALAAVTITRPGALLLDEPTRGLDPQAKQALAHILRGWREEGMALLLVTHDVELAAGLADRAVLLEQGQVALQGPPAEVFSRSGDFSTQMARLFPGRGWLTPEDVLREIRPA